MKITLTTDQAMVLNAILWTVPGEGIYAGYISLSDELDKLLKAPWDVDYELEDTKLPELERGAVTVSMDGPEVVLHGKHVDLYKLQYLAYLADEKDLEEAIESQLSGLLLEETGPTDTTSGYAYTLYCGMSNSEGAISREMVEDFASSSFGTLLDGYTLVFGKGYWQGVSEECAVFTVASTVNLDTQIQNIADLYKVVFKQESVLVTRQAIDIL